MLLTQISKIRVNFIDVNTFTISILTGTFLKFALILLRVNFVTVVKMLRYITTIRLDCNANESWLFGYKLF